MQDLVATVLEQTGRPLDRWAVAAVLESNGVRDVDARERYGRRDVFDVADEVYAQCLARAAPAPARREIPVARGRRLSLGALHYVQGGFFFVPLTLQLGSLLFLGYGQWASLDFTGHQASVVGISLIAGFALTGAFGQALGYLGPYFAEPGRHRLVARVVIRLVGLGVAAVFVVAGLAWLANLALGWWDRRSLVVGLVYFGLVSLVSLLSSVLYMLKQYLGLLAATVGGIAVVGLALHHTSLGIYGAHWTGLATTLAIQAAWAAAVLGRRFAGTTPDMRNARLPRVSTLVALAVPYAAYGAAYSVLMFSDRVAAWSAGAHGQFPFQFRGSYEVALDWALISVVPALAMLEVIVHAFTERLAAAGQDHRAIAAEEHTDDLHGFYERQLLLVVMLLAGGSVVVFIAGRMVGQGGVSKLSELFADTTTLHVYPIALAGFWLLVWALLNGLFLLTLGRPELVLRAIVPAIVVTVVTAFALSRTLEYWTAIGGFVAGAFVFAVLATLAARRVLGAVGYYYYAAY